MKFFLKKGEFVLNKSSVGYKIRQADLRYNSSEFRPCRVNSLMEELICDKLCSRVNRSRTWTELWAIILQPEKLSYYASNINIDFNTTGGGHDGIGIAILCNDLTNSLLDCFEDKFTTVTIQVEIKPLSYNPFDPNGKIKSVKSSAMHVRRTDFGEYACEDTKFPQEASENSENFKAAIRSGVEIRGEICLIVEIAESKQSETTSVTNVDNLQLVKKILHEEVASDVVLIPGEGNPVKAHKAFLTAHSNVFATMFQSEVEETNPQTVQMPDMSEESLKAFMAFLYYWDTTEAHSNPMLAFELLNAAHKYNISLLETEMKKLLLFKEDQWYTMEVATKLFLFVGNLQYDRDVTNNLKLKAFNILKANFNGLEQSPTYRELFEKCPEAAMELCQYAFVGSPKLPPKSDKKIFNV